MKADKTNALALAIEREILSATRQCVFLNASPLPGFDPSTLNSFHCIQGFKPEYNALKDAGYNVEPQLTRSGQFEQAALILGRNRKFNEARIARIWNQLSTGGRLVVAGNKTDGVQSVRKWFAACNDVTDSYSKYHSVVFWADKYDDTPMTEPSIEKSVDGLQLAEGMFSSNGPDKGSVLLAEHFDERIKGQVADLGSGWGFLSSKLQACCKHISQLDLFEADYSALQAARQNVISTEKCNVTYHWVDVTTEFVRKPYDWVIMNPPFHKGRSSEPGLGQRFCEVAASTLPTGGRLMMVANVNLPYEHTLESCFRRFEKLDQREGYKVLLAIK